MERRMEIVSGIMIPRMGTPLEAAPLSHAEVRESNLNKFQITTNHSRCKMDEV
jgi:hypothetical protein